MRSSGNNQPFLLSPAAKDYLWGGRRLNDDFAKGIDVFPLAETWECSTHPDGISQVISGVHAGKNLRDVISAHPAYLGTRYSDTGELPILVKLIDAANDLSVQVHPDDDYANRHENGQSGKTEMWYVLDAARDASLVVGLAHTTSEETVRRAIKAGTIGNLLQTIPVRKDDVFYIAAGTIHAIGKGCLIAEIQENSNLTYRLYDYDRVDKNGEKRPLHIDKALAVADLNALKAPRQPMRVLRYEPGVARELLARCKYFEVHRMLVNTERRQRVTFRSDHLSYRVLLCVDGCGTFACKNETLNVFKGDCVFVPADSEEIVINGMLQLLDVRS
ncbi:MAG: class I mannose-6-phosphate isomerase [Lachnospiraceae bacterium]|nr:class I mannose-6-phosphate isomerase [Lachnospiraceae bacterium]